MKSHVDHVARMYVCESGIGKQIIGFKSIFAFLHPPKMDRFIDQIRMQNAIFWPEWYRPDVRKCYKTHCFLTILFWHHTVIHHNVKVFVQGDKNEILAVAQARGRFLMNRYRSDIVRTVHFSYDSSNEMQHSYFFVSVVDQTLKNKIVKNPLVFKAFSLRNDRFLTAKNAIDK